MKDAKLIKEITVSEEGTISSDILTTSNKHDVTGGILLKLQTAIDIVRFTKEDTPVFICKVGSQAAECACLTGTIDSLSGTKINKCVI